MLSREFLTENIDHIEKIADEIDAEDLSLLLEMLSSKIDLERYSAFLALKFKSEKSDMLYSHWDSLVKRMRDENSYQRSIGIMLISENVRWDKQEKFDDIVDEFLSHCEDRKFITSRQTVQSIKNWYMFRSDLWDKTVSKLTNIDIDAMKDSQKRLMALDVLKVLCSINKLRPSSEISEYISSVIKREYMDHKAVNTVNGWSSSV